MRLYVEGYVKDEPVSACDNARICSRVYAHGDLERMAGYDIVDCSKDEEFDYSTERIEHVDAILCDGTVVPAILYYWGKRGLLVAENDLESREYAQESYDRKVDFI